MLEGDPIDRVVLVWAELVRLGRVDVGAELLVGAEVDVLGPGNDQDNNLPLGAYTVFRLS